MTEFEKADTNGNGTIERSEWNRLSLESARLEIADQDLKRNTVLHWYVDLSIYYFVCFSSGI